MPYQSGPNTANFNNCAIGSFGNITGTIETSVGSNGGPSAYGTFDQTGNGDEIMYMDDGIVQNSGPTLYLVTRGGKSTDSYPFLQKESRLYTIPGGVSSFTNGFFPNTIRICTQNNPLNLPYFVEIGDLNNVGESQYDAFNNFYNVGGVPYLYQINQYQLTVCEYTQFLNAIAKTDIYDLYSPFTIMGLYITRNGQPGSYTYSVVRNMEKRPIKDLTYCNMLRYCNWLHNGKPIGSINSLTTETGAYPVNGQIYFSSIIPKTSIAKYWIPTESEWYKAAYYKGGGINAGYWTYATQTNNIPSCIRADGIGGGPISSLFSCGHTATTTTPDPNIFPPGSNTANFNSCAIWAGTTGIVTTVGSNGGPSAYGTYDQNGNTWEWVCEDSVSIVSIRRGGNWNTSPLSKSNTRSNDNVYYRGEGGFGFRLVTSTNPLNLPFFVTVRDINNTSDTNFYGSVGYEYKIGQYVVTNCEYVEFLNSIAKTDTYNVYDTQMTTESRGGIIRSGVSGNYSYSVKINMDNKPVVYINWLSAARYCNWLHNGKPNGNQNANTTEAGSYILSGQQSGSTVTKNLNAKYWLPTEDEWYKAAYYKGGGINAGYWAYATQNNNPPTCISANSVGNGPITTKYSCITTTTTTTTTPSPTTTTTSRPDHENFFIHDHGLYMDSSVLDFNQPSTNHCVRINLIDAVTDKVVQYIDHCVSVKTCECLQPTSTTTSTTTTSTCPPINIPTNLCANGIPQSNYPIVNSSGCIIGYQCPESTTTTTTTTTITPTVGATELYTWGMNYDGELGHGTPMNVPSGGPCGILINSGVLVGISGYYTKDPTLIASGSFTDVFCLPQSMTRTTNVLDSSGNLYICGAGYFDILNAQNNNWLGLQPCPPPPKIPTTLNMIQYPTLTLVAQNYASLYKSVHGELALSGSGYFMGADRVMSIGPWSNGDYSGKVGERLSIPCKKISSKSSSGSIYASHKLMITKSGELYGYGGNYFNQLGTGDQTSIANPTKLHIKTNWVDASVGGSNYNFSLAVDSFGDLYACGSNVYGQLGTGSNTIINIWTKINTNMPPLKRVFAGMGISFGLTYNNELYRWGRIAGCGGSNYPVKIEGRLNNQPYNDNWIDVSINPRTNYALLLNNSGELYQYGKIAYLDFVQQFCTPTKITIPSGIFWLKADVGVTHAAALGRKIS